MSTATSEQALTPAQKTSEILSQLAASTECPDPKKLNLAILEVALDLVGISDVVDQIRHHYRLLDPPKMSKTMSNKDNLKAADTSKKPIANVRRTYDLPLTPIARVDGHYIDPNAPPDPHFLLRLYGHRQLEQALDDYDLPALKKVVAQLRKQYPQTKPKTATQRYDLIEYIARLTTGSE